MATNPYITKAYRPEQNLLEDLTIESLKMYGQDLYYLPRTIVNEDKILGDDVPSLFSSSYKVEMYIENTEGFDGEGDLFAKFGVEIRDQATFVLARRRWQNTVASRNNEINGSRPREGDLIYLPLSNSLFQIMQVEHESPFYQLNNLYTYKLRCELFEYNDEDLDTGVDAIDDIEADYAYEYKLSVDSSTVDYIVGENVTQTFTSASGDPVILRGEVTQWADSDSILHVVHSGADDGKFHEWTTNIAIVGTESGATGTVSTVIENNQLHENEQNNVFNTISDTFLDFSESNPFGDPSGE